MNRACDAVGVSRATAYRQLKPKVSSVPLKRAYSQRRIPDRERKQILGILDSERFLDQPPREVYATLLTEGAFSGVIRSPFRWDSIAVPTAFDQDSGDSIVVPTAFDQHSGAFERPLGRQARRHLGMVAAHEATIHAKDSRSPATAPRVWL